MPHPSSYYTQHLHHYLKSLLLPIPCLDPDITTLKTPTAPEYTLVLDSPHSPTEARVTDRSSCIAGQSHSSRSRRIAKWIYGGKSGNSWTGDKGCCLMAARVKPVTRVAAGLMQGQTGSSQSRCKSGICGYSVSAFSNSVSMLIAILVAIKPP